MEKLDTSSDRVCHACARETRKAFELHNFIYSNLQKEKQAEFLMIRQIEVLKQGKDINHPMTTPLL